MSKVTVAALQLAFTDDTAANLRAVSELVREAAGNGAEVVLPPELFEGAYFCRIEDESLFANARAANEHPSVLAMQELAAELKIWIPTSFFEADGPHYYNSLAMIGPDGKVAGIYRKSHIPDGPGYQEKFYFRPGDTGFKVWPTGNASVGTAICWDQWFPEAARVMALKGAEILFYPTAIGSEPPPAPPVDSRDHWRRVMQGHAAANYVPIVAANRIGAERGQTGELSFYGSSFVAGPTGEIIAELGRDEEGLVLARFDFAAIAK